jgi:hypothetical protein
MSFTLRGRLESRLVGALAPLVAACGLALFVTDWWPLELAGLMIGTGLALEVAVYHRLFAYQPGWLALPLGAVELVLTMVFVRLAGTETTLAAGLAFFAGSWLLGQILVHAIFPLRWGYAEDGGELGRTGVALAAAALAVFAAAGGVFWATRPPTVTLAAGLHQGRLVVASSQTLVGEPGAVVLGGILVTSDDVTVRGITVRGGDYGIEVVGADDVVLDDVVVEGARRGGISARASHVTIKDCNVGSLTDEFAQGIAVSFGGGRAPSLVERCVVDGAYEGIVTRLARARLSDNRVTRTTLRAIAVTERSTGKIEDNHVVEALGVAIFCGGHSRCEIDENSVSDTQPDRASGDYLRRGYGILAFDGARVDLDGNTLVRSPGGIAALVRARITGDY